MRKLFFYVFSIFLCMQSCSQSDDLINGKFDLEEEKMQQEISFPDHIEAYGKAVAKELRVTVLRLNEMNVDYSKATGTKEFREKFYKDWFDANPTIAKTRATGVPLTSIMDPIEFAERYKAIQYKYLWVILVLLFNLLGIIAFLIWKQYLNKMSNSGSHGNV